MAVFIALVACCASTISLADPLPRDIHVTDVTPASFTVAWTTDAASTGALAVFTDVLGATPVAGAVIETSYVRAGSAAVASAAEDLGVLRVRVSGLDPATPYFFHTTTTPKAAGAPVQLPASGALYSTVTASLSVAESSNDLAADVLDTDGSSVLPGALLLVELPGGMSPLSAIAGDGYPASLAAAQLANIHDVADGETLVTVGGELATLSARAGTVGSATASATLDSNGGMATFQQAPALTLVAPQDTDLDGMPDAWETANGLIVGVDDSAGNGDSDGLSNLEEYELGTDPGDADSDGDGLSDGSEVNTHGTLATEFDTDRDDRSDGDEVNGPTVTDPLDADSDDDGVKDGVETANGTDPNNPGDFPILDGDSDGVGDLVDNCPTIPNPGQEDTDADTLGDACDGDDDADGVGDGADNCPLDSNTTQDDGDGDNVGDACDNCPADSNPVQEDNEADGLGDICDPDDDNDGVNDVAPAAPPSDTPFSITSATGIVSTTLPVVSNNAAFISVGKFFVDESRSVTLGFFDLKNRTWDPQTLSPADQAKVGWTWMGIDTNNCNCFTVQNSDMITAATDSGNIAAVFAAGAETVPSIIFVSDDGSTWTQYFVPSGPLATLHMSSQVGGPLDNCQFVANPAQLDTDGDGIGDFCDITADDLDGDDVLNTADNCPNTHNPGQQDFDLDGLGDACDADDDNDGVDDVDEATLMTDSMNADTDGDGILDGAEDFDFDGRSNSQELLDATSPFDPDVTLTTGLNFFAYPIEVPGGLTAFGLLTALGDDTEVSAVLRLNPLTQTYEKASYVGGVPTGFDFAVTEEQGYLVNMLGTKTLTFVGTPNCPTHDLEPGTNLIGFPCFGGGFTTRDLLAHLGPVESVATAQTFDARTGRFETAAWKSGLTVGANVPVFAGQGLLVYSRQQLSAIAPPITPPTVAITSPADASTTDTTPAPIAGTVTPSDAVVVVNGVVATLDGIGGWTASIDLLEGANTVTATARTVENLQQATSISVTLDTSVPVDYTLNRPDSVADSRVFFVDPGAIGTLDHFHVVLTGLPSGVTYAPGSISISFTTGEVTAPYTISTDAAAAVGVHMFTAEYQFHDAAHVELDAHTLPFTIEVLP